MVDRHVSPGPRTNGASSVAVRRNKLSLNVAVKRRSHKRLISVLRRFPPEMTGGRGAVRSMFHLHNATDAGGAQSPLMEPGRLSQMLGTDNACWIKGVPGTFLRFAH